MKLGLLAIVFCRSGLLINSSVFAETPRVKNGSFAKGGVEP